LVSILIGISEHHMPTRGVAEKGLARVLVANPQAELHGTPDLEKAFVTKSPCKTLVESEGLEPSHPILSSPLRGTIE
jgi:hypothetical protein